VIGAVVSFRAEAQLSARRRCSARAARGATEEQAHAGRGAIGPDLRSV